jgi:hypothetical protein
VLLGKKETTLKRVLYLLGSSIALAMRILPEDFDFPNYLDTD